MVMINILSFNQKNWIQKWQKLAAESGGMFRINVADYQGKQSILRLQTIELWTVRDIQIMLRIWREEKEAKMEGVKDVAEVKLAWPDHVD